MKRSRQSWLYGLFAFLLLAAPYKAAYSLEWHACDPAGRGCSYSSSASGACSGVSGLQGLTFDSLYRVSPNWYSCLQTRPDDPPHTAPTGRASAVTSSTTCPDGSEPEAGDCSNEDRDDGDPECSGGTNPINIFTGYKFQHEVDYEGSKSTSLPLTIERTYRWKMFRDFPYAEWNIIQVPRIDVVAQVPIYQPPPPNSNAGYLAPLIFYRVKVIHPNFSEMAFTSGSGVSLAGNTTTRRLQPVLGQNFRYKLDMKFNFNVNTQQLSLNQSWTLTYPDGTVEEYSPPASNLGASGLIRTKTAPDGQALTYQYEVSQVNGGDGDDLTLDRIINQSGEMLVYGRNSSGQITSITDPNGETYRYAYNSSGMIQYVSYPDETPGSNGSNPFGEDNPYRTYHYENTTFPRALTGITDESGARYATWTYDAEGRATSSQHAGGADNKTIDYTHIDDATDPRVTVTNELGKATTYHFTEIRGERKVTQVEGHASANCLAASTSITYDTFGYVASRTDWKGNITNYTHSPTGQELSRTEAAGTPQERTITTTWHDDFEKPLKITEPGRETVFVYDSSGRLLNRTVQALP